MRSGDVAWGGSAKHLSSIPATSFSLERPTAIHPVSLDGFLRLSWNIASSHSADWTTEIALTRLLRLPVSLPLSCILPSHSLLHSLLFPSSHHQPTMDTLQYRGSTYSLASTASDSDSDTPPFRKSHHVFPVLPDPIDIPSHPIDAAHHSHRPKKPSPKMSSLLTALRRLSFKDDAKPRRTHRRAHSALTITKSASTATVSTIIPILDPDSGLSAQIQRLELHRSNSVPVRHLHIPPTSCSLISPSRKLPPNPSPAPVNASQKTKRNRIRPRTQSHSDPSSNGEPGPRSEPPSPGSSPLHRYPIPDLPLPHLPPLILPLVNSFPHPQSPPSPPSHPSKPPYKTSRY